MENDAMDIRWQEIDPLGNTVVLLNSTYEEHLVGDHDSKDVTFRQKMEQEAKITIRQPASIRKDKDEANHPQRRNYCRQILISSDDGTEKAKEITVIVDGAPIPNEVVTWIPSNRPIAKGEIIYEE